jgi:integrase/recombinase XerD
VSDLKKSRSGVWEGIVQDFRLQLVADGNAEGTVGTYLQAILQFTDFHKDAISTNSITQNSVNQWLSKFNPRRGTLNLKKVALRQFLGYIKSDYGFKKEIRIVIKDLQRPEPAYLTIPEQERLLQYVKGLGEVSQHFVMLKLMLYSGLRISEVLSLKFSDVEGSTLTLRQTKHGNTRRKHLKNEIARMLKIYVNARRSKYPLNEMPSGSEDYLFLVRYAGKFKSFTRQGVNKVLKQFAKSVGITKKVSPHILRHSFSVRFLNRVGSLRGLQTYLGHRDIKTTAIYTHVSDEQLKEELERL